MSAKSKLLWRCRRGVKELDVVLTRYVEKNYDESSATEKQTFERLLNFQDPDLLRLLLNQDQSEDEAISAIIEQIRF